MTGQLVLGVVLGVVICGSPPQTQTSSCAVPLLVVDSQVDPNRRKVTLTIENTGTKVVTSWHVTIVAGTEPGAAHGGYGTDAFRQFEGLGPGDGYVRPKGTVTRTTDLPHSGDPAHVVVIPDSAVFADVSFCGDRREAEWVFERRRAQLEAWEEIAGELEKARRSANADAETLDGILSRIDDAIARRGPDIVRQTFRANLSLRLGEVRAGRRQVLQILSELLEEASRNVAAAIAHIPRQVNQRGQEATVSSTLKMRLRAAAALAASLGGVVFLAPYLAGSALRPRAPTCVSPSPSSWM